MNSYSATLTKLVNKSYAVVGDVLDYEVVASNTGTIPLTNVTFKDLIPNGATFVDGSVFVDGINKPSANPNNGFTISDILPVGNVVVMFKDNGI
ncbi:DUF11 domain-containing protein [Paraclostridium bifermentans]|nr:DUF11 domain-containing protein [Paraclostridium bifermentans]